MSPLSSSSVRWAQRHTAIQLSSPPTTKPLVKARISRAGRPARTAPKGHSMWETKYGTCLGMGIFWKDWDSLGCWFVEMWIKGRIWMYGCSWCMFETCWKLRLFKNKREMLWSFFHMWQFLFFLWFNHRTKEMFWCLLLFLAGEGRGGINHKILLMDKILHHLGWLKPYTYWNNHHPWWCRILSINSM